MPLNGSLWLCVSLYVYVLLCTTLYDFVQRCMTLYDSVWLFMTIIDLAQVYSRNIKNFSEWITIVWSENFSFGFIEFLVRKHWRSKNSFCPEIFLGPWIFGVNFFFGPRGRGSGKLLSLVQCVSVLSYCICWWVVVVVVVAVVVVAVTGIKQSQLLVFKT